MLARQSTLQLELCPQTFYILFLDKVFLLLSGLVSDPPAFQLAGIIELHHHAWLGVLCF
jgi:hypothetical protein